MSYQQAVESRLRQTSRQLCSLQLGLTLSHIEHSDGADHFLQPPSLAILHQHLHVKLRVGQRVGVRVSRSIC